MASKKNKRQGSKNVQPRKQAGKKGRKIDVRAVFTPLTVDDYESDDDIDELTSSVNRSLESIQMEMEEFGFSRDKLEYRDPRGKGRETVFRPLTSQVVEHWQGGVMEIRDPEHYFEHLDDSDDEEYDESHPDDEGFGNEGFDPADEGEDDDYDYPNYDDEDPVPAWPAPVPELRARIAALALACREADFVRVGPGKLRDATGGSMDTESWVTARAAADPALLHLIVDHVGALDHLVRCIHLDPVWEGNLHDNDPGKGTSDEKRVNPTR